jgi:DNA-binding transcriptional regulator LsrR (DeoR family)
MKEPTIAQTLQRAKDADACLVGLGGIHDHLNLVAEGYMTAAGWDELVAGGMVGDIGARYFDASGRGVECDVNDRVIGLTLDELRRIPLRIVVAGGRDKDRAIHAALRTGLISVLVTDAGTAARVIAAHRQEQRPRPVKGASRG